MPPMTVRVRRHNREKRGRELPLEIKLESDQQIQEHSNMEQESARIAALKSFQQTFCRTCLRKISEGDAVSIFSTKSFYNGQALYQLFKEITPTLMEQNDALPNNICSNCARRVKQSFAFKRSIEKAHKTLIYTVRKAEVTHNSALARKLTSNFKDLLDNFSNEMSQIADDDEGGAQSCADTKPNIANSTKPVNMDKVRRWKMNIYNLIEGRVANIVPITNRTTNKPSILQTFLSGKQLPEKQGLANNTLVDLEIANSKIVIGDEAADVIEIEDESDDDAVTENNVAEQLHMIKVTNILDKQCSNPEEEVANIRMECGDFTLPLGFDASDTKRIACSKCDKKFTAASILQRHLLYHSLDILQLEDGYAENQTQGPTTTIITTNNTTPRASPRVLTKPCEFCEQEILVGTMRKHIRLNHQLEFQMKKHLRFTCTKCGESYRKSATLERHIKTSHDEKFKCDRCDKRFRWKGLLDQHLQHIHRVKLTAVCYICGKTISRAGMQAHIRTHVSTKSIKCTVEGCHVLLKYKNSLRDHLVQVHGTEMTHMCEFCGKTFPAKNSLRRHLQRHTKSLQYTCQICEKRFREAAELRKHAQRVHQRLKIYNCPVCPNTFAYRDSVRTHCGRFHPEHPLARGRTHYSTKYKNYSASRVLEKTFPCIVCSRMFACDYNVKTHIRRYHPTFLFREKQTQLDEAMSSTIEKSPKNCVDV